MNELDTKIRAALDDLYKIDPAFRQHEEKIAAIIKEMLLAKPDTKFDEQFAENLRRKIMAQADMLKEKHQLSLFNRVTALKRWNYALGFVVVAMAVATGGWYYQLRKPNAALVSKAPEIMSSKINIKRLGSNAFGKLALSSEGSKAGVYGMGGGGGSMAIAPQSDSATSPEALRIKGPENSYHLVYKGGKFEVPSQMDVFRRIKTPASGMDAASLLKNLNFGIINMDVFSNVTLQNMNLAEDKDFGYMFYINLQENSISISENWTKWPTPESQCKDSQCFNSKKLKITDVPDDQTMISWTQQFLKDHNISMENYGTPFVESSWKNDYNMATDKANSYIPNIITVIYPLKINGQEIYDEGGNKTGLAVSVDLYARKVSGIGELYALNFDSSTYDLETDTAKLIKAAENGGQNGAFFASGGTGKSAEVDLGTPQLVYVKTYQSQGKPGTPDEIITPALIFPVINSPQTQQYMYFPKNIVVNLPKDFQNNNNPVKILPAQ